MLSLKKKWEIHLWFPAWHYERTPTLIVQSVKNLPARQETGVWFLGGEDPLEKEMTTRSSILAWRISWTKEPGRLQSMGSHRVRHDWAPERACARTHTHITHTAAAALSNRMLKEMGELGGGQKAEHFCIMCCWMGVSCQHFEILCLASLCSRQNTRDNDSASLKQWW